MNFTLTWQLAIRYLRGKRSANAVPVLSRISMVAIAFGSAAMIILFSVFNGFETLVKNNYKAFYPDIKVAPAKGKFFSLNNIQYEGIAKLQGVEQTTGVIKDQVLCNNNDQEKVVTLVGIDSNFMKVNDIRPFIKQGHSYVSDTNGITTAIMGGEIANILGADVKDIFARIELFYPNSKTGISSLDPSGSFQSLQLKPDGVFRIQEDFDDKYVLALIAAVQDLFGEEGKYSSLEIKLSDNADPDKLKQQIYQLLGSSFTVETRYEQNKTLYMVMGTEKLAVFAILLLVLLIASFNMIGALSLLVLEKQKDIAILKAMGAQNATIRQIFISEGILWSLTGGIIGMIAGAGICLGQQQFKWIKMGGSFIVDAYPVRMQPGDFVVVIVTIIIVGLLAAWYPAIRSTRTVDPSLKAS